MKYIRTENEIYEVVGFDAECIIPSPIIKMNGKLTHCSDYKNCKQADTIEGLCDRFVAETCDNIKFWVEPTLENAKIYCGIKKHLWCNMD